MIKAIETKYNGCRFRSRLEARWAVLFDEVGIRWEYEPEGFEISNGGNSWYYLPDFWLPESKTWVEVKGDNSTVDWEMIEWAIEYGGQIPNVGDSTGTTRGLLWLNSIPSKPSCDYGNPAFPIIQHHKGIWIESAAFTKGQLHTTDTGSCFVAGANQIEQEINARFGRSWVGPASLSSAFDAARMARFEHKGR